MKLSQLLKNDAHQFVKGGDIDIEGICYDSRKTQKGFLFVCIKGFKTDGHKYIEHAVKQGAVAILCQDDVQTDADITIVKTENTRIALGNVSSEFYGNPSEKMLILGVTGTNGKTTTTYLLNSILKEHGLKVGIIGTIENRIGDSVIPADKTTPESLELNMLFDEMSKKGVGAVAMEVSSHSLDLHRVDFCKFDVGIFTNLTQDHLDYHETMENYRNAKIRLFKMCKHGVLNGDDENSKFFVPEAKSNLITFGLNEMNDISATNIKMDSAGVEFTVNIYNTPTNIKLPIPGKFTVYNALGAIAAAMCLKIPAQTIKDGLSKNTGVPGRVQSINTDSGKNIIVDYAHTPDSLSNILEAVKEFTKGKIITVFGCGGDRDKTKRPLMGEIAGSKSDYAIITSDNPRSEEPLSIILDAEVGMKKTSCKYVKIIDREEAINYAVKIAEKGDVVVIAGKGHENYQILGDRTIHFDDAEKALQAAELLKEI